MNSNGYLLRSDSIELYRELSQTEEDQYLNQYFYRNFTNQQGFIQNNDLDDSGMKTSM